MHILTVDFQLVTKNIASTLDEKVRLVDGALASYNFIVILSAMAVMVLCKQFAPGRLGAFISTLYHRCDAEKMTREWNSPASLTGFLMTASYIALLALFIQKSAMVFGGGTSLYGGAGFFLEACLFVSAFVLVRYLFININGWIFGTQPASQRHAIIHISMMTSMNFVLMTLTLILTFYQSKFWVILGIVIIIAMNIYRVVKTFIYLQILIKNGTLKNFLYLCTLEIIPISVAFTMAFRLIATNSVL
ncbi:MAG: DUF4271 domain-containing protein [Bacteroidales bacterium]|nr:DUF4271 domain-containing protein [Bacteroidales bacterium]